MVRVLKVAFFALWNISIIFFSLSIIFEDYLKGALIVDTGSLIEGIIAFGTLFFILFILFYLICSKSINPKLRLKDIWYVVVPFSLLTISLISFKLSSNIRLDKKGY